METMLKSVTKQEIEDTWQFLGYLYDGGRVYYKYDTTATLYDDKIRFKYDRVHDSIYPNSFQKSMEINL